MADGDVPLDREPEHEERRQVLGGEEEDGEEFAPDGHVQDFDVPRAVQLVIGVESEEDEVIHGQRGEVTPGRRTHLRLYPYKECQEIPGESYDVPYRRQVFVYVSRRLTIDRKEFLHRDAGAVSRGRVQCVVVVQVGVIRADQVEQR